MRCKHHPTDLTSAVGVCATCLRHRLFTLIDEQTRLEEALAVAKQLASSCPTDGSHKLPEPRPLPFPRSVSPYVGSRRSSDHKYLHRFFSTPQVGPAYDAACGFSMAENTMEMKKKKKQNKFDFFKNLFRSRSDKYNSDRSVCSKLDQRFPVSPHRDSSSSNWLSFLNLRRKKKPAVEETPSRSNNCRRPCRISNRGMSPERGVETDDYFESGYSSESSSHGPRRTPVMTLTPMRRKRRGQSKSTSGMAFCLSPLVRASPGRRWSQKGTMQPEIGAAGEVRVMGKPYLTTAASFNGNRSRKLVDLGRVNLNR